MMTTNDGCIPEAVVMLAMPNFLPCRCDEPGLGPAGADHVCPQCHFIIPKGGQLWAQEAFPNFRVYLSLAGPVGIGWATHLMMLSDPRDQGSMANVSDHGHWLWEPRKLAAELYKCRFTFQGYMKDIIAEIGRRHERE